LVDNIRDVHKIYMIISTEEVFIAPWHLAPQGASKKARCQRAMDLFDQYTIFISEDAGTSLIDMGPLMCARASSFAFLPNY
jgi:hypothetical protein